MDEFDVDRPELNGALVSMEFGSGGRIIQIWVADPNLPEQSEETQFVLPPLTFGEEFAEDYFPGTIMLGARQNPNDPWVLSRNTDAQVVGEDSSAIVEFQYEFSLLPEIAATGRFHEQTGSTPQIVWDLELTNEGTATLEIGELAFPLAFNNLFDGFARNDAGAYELLRDRFAIHKFIGGAASYFAAIRMNAEPPGLLVTPGDNTSWEFYNTVPASLGTPYQWDGVSVVYAHSKATIEREEWQEWFNGHTSRMLDPGETARYQIRFIPLDRDRAENLPAALQVSGRPAMSLLPGAVAPIEVGIAVEVGGATPTQFFSDVEMELETDSDEEGGFCFLKPSEPGAVRLTFEDTKGRTSYGHFLFIEPIEDLIEKRARWIMEHQIARDPGFLQDAIVPANILTSDALRDPEDFAGPFGITSSLADALFLAEKNVLSPDERQIAALDAYIQNFLRDDVQNPGDGSIGSVFLDAASVASGIARPQLYSLAANLYHTMYRISESYGGVAWDGRQYLNEAAKTVEALFRDGFPRGIRWAGLPGLFHLRSLPGDLYASGEEEIATSIARLLMERAVELTRRRIPFATQGPGSPTGLEEAFQAARAVHSDELEEMIWRCAGASRSQSPSWWWYGSSPRAAADDDGIYPGVFDRGELCLGPASAGVNVQAVELLDRDLSGVPESSLRVAYGGLIGLWALVRTDGAAAMAFCPDSASRQFGMNWLTGDVGLSLWHYLRGIASVVIPGKTSGIATFGCHVETDENDWMTITPWDGVGRRIVAPRLGLSVESFGAKIEKFRFDLRKRHAVLTLSNRANKDQDATIRIKGLWGDRYLVDGRAVETSGSDLAIGVTLKAKSTTTLDVKAQG